MSARERFIGYDEFDAFTRQDAQRERRFELLHGEIFEIVPTEQHGLIITILLGELYVYLQRRPGGQLVTEVRSRVPGDNSTALQPDISYFADATRPVQERGAVPVMPDLVVEVKSPDDTFVRLREKAIYYLTHGSAVVWLVFPAQQQIEIHTADAPITLLSGGDVLDGGQILPGFALPLSTLFSVLLA